MKTLLALKGRTRWGSIGCAMGAWLLCSALTGELRAQDFLYTTINGAITITEYTGPGGNVVIPASIDGLPVTTLGGQAFAGRQSLTSVTIPDSVTNIEDGILTRGGGLGAFSFCSGLTNVTLGNRVSYIGMGTFTWCTNLTRVSLPDSVITIGDFAFHYCKGLAEATLGKGLTELGLGVGYVFNGCTNLSRVTIPVGVTNLGNYAFCECASLTHLSLPASVARIGDHAFSFCASLAGVYFKGGAPILLWPDGVFYGSSNVSVYYLPGTLGWGATFGGRPAMLWNPEVRTDDAHFGVRQNRFGFNITGTADIPLVIEASTDLAGPLWTPLQSCTLTNGSFYFANPEWTNYPKRFYRIRSP